MFESTFQIDLGDDIAMLRDAVRDFAQHEIAPRAAEIDSANEFPADLWRKLGELGVMGLTVGEAYGGTALGYLAHMVAMEEISRASACGGPELRRALQPVRQSDPPQRQRGAEAEVPAQADQRRACRRAGDERAGCRLRRGQHGAEGRAARRPLRAQRQQDVDHQRRRRRHGDRLRQDRPADGRARHDGVHRRKGLQGFQPRQASRQARHARLQHAIRCSSRTARCRRTT